MAALFAVMGAMSAMVPATAVADTSSSDEDVICILVLRLC
jgi:hypothetical protein